MMTHAYQQWNEAEAEVRMPLLKWTGGIDLGIAGTNEFDALAKACEAEKVCTAMAFKFNNLLNRTVYF